MNQEKIGKFILELRKESGMTQAELADKLGITDRAISKWENGRGLPDLSLLEPLCSVLGVSINELLSGERLQEKEYSKKAEENIISTIDYTDKKLKKTRKVFTYVIIAFLVLVISVVTMFLVDIGKMRNNEAVVFSTWGFDYAPALDIPESEINSAITKYLLEVADKEKRNDTEKVFVSMRVYLLEELEKDTKYNIYAWVLEERYYSDTEKIIKDSASSLAYKFEVERMDGEFVVTDSRTPRDGGFYTEDLKNIFPQSVRRDIESVQTDGTLEKLESDIEKQLKLYYHIAEY